VDTQVIMDTCCNLQVIDLLEGYKYHNSDSYTREWDKYQQKLYKYQLSKNNFKGWVKQNDRDGKVTLTLLSYSLFGSIREIQDYY